MRSWKLILCLLLAVVVLVGCGKTKEENTMASDVATKAETNLAVPEKGIPVLMYHMIGDIEDNDAVLKESHLREQMKFLKDNGFHPLTLDQLYEYVMFNKPVPEKPVDTSIGNPDNHGPKGFNLNPSFLLTGNFISHQALSSICDLLNRRLLFGVNG